MKLAALALAALALGACTTTPKRAPVAAVAAPPVAQAAPAPPPAVVRKVPVSCVPKGLSPAPKYPDTDARLRAAAEAADRYQLLAAGRLLRIRRLAELERIVDACRTPD